MANRSQWDGERPRDRDRARYDGAHAPKDNGNQSGAFNDRRRSRSPRRERGGRRSDNNRYRSRSPIRHKERPATDEGRGGRDDRRNDTRGGWGPRPSGNNGGPRDRDRDRESRSVTQKPGGPVKTTTTVPQKSDEPEDTLMTDSNRPEGMDEETWDIKRTMGFSVFKSTKETKVPGNHKNFGIRRDKKMEARQYMNRQGGFNRPLSPGRG